MKQSCDVLFSEVAHVRQKVSQAMLRPGRSLFQTGVFRPSVGRLANSTVSFLYSTWRDTVVTPSRDRLLPEDEMMPNESGKSRSNEGAGSPKLLNLRVVS